MLIVSFSSALLLGCATPTGVKSADSAGSDLEKLEKQLEQSRGQIATVMTALNEMTEEGSDVKKGLNSFSSAVDSLKKTTASDKSVGDEMEASINDYMTEWGTQITSMSNEELKKQSTARHTELSRQFQEAKTAFSEANKSYEPFLSHLNDLVTYLSTDLSPAGIEAASKTITDLKSEGASVQRGIQNAAEKLKVLRTSMGR